MTNLLFFGSFLHHSTKVAQALLEDPTINLVGVVTTPPMPAGRKKIITKTHTHEWAEAHNLPVFTPDDFDENPASILTHRGKILEIDLFLTAGYGKLLPQSWLTYPKIASLNLHFSLLPKFRGANPAEWALLINETEVGITLMQMDPEFDTGNIISQSSIPVDQPNNPNASSGDTRETLYEKLYELGAECLPVMLQEFGQLEKSNLSLGIPQPSLSPTPPAYRFYRAQSYIPWEIFSQNLNHQSFDPHKLPAYLLTAYQHLFSDKPATLKDQSSFLERTIRALVGFPGVWTYLPMPKGKQRLKIHTAHLTSNRLSLDQVQLEGKTPTFFKQLEYDASK